MTTTAVYPGYFVDISGDSASRPTGTTDHGRSSVSGRISAGVPGTEGSNTSGRGTAVRPTSAARTRFRHRIMSRERPFETVDKTGVLRHRVRSVAQSPGGILLSLLAAAFLVCCVPAITGGQSGTDTPAPEPAAAGSGDLDYIRVSDGQSLYDIARSSLADVPVGEAMAEISALNDLGDEDPRPGTLVSVPAR
jgi:hypothetical protein